MMGKFSNIKYLLTLGQEIVPTRSGGQIVEGFINLNCSVQLGSSAVLQF